MIPLGCFLLLLAGIAVMARNIAFLRDAPGAPAPSRHGQGSPS